MIPLAVNIAVFDDTQRLLLTRREDYEVWCLPGGAVEEGESLAEAAIRETAEETGLEVELTRLVGIYSRPRFGPVHSLVLFAANVTGGSLCPQPDEVIDIGWFAATELPEDLAWGQRERIQDALAGIGGSVVRSNPVARPDDWPYSRVEQYALRDRSGLSRREFYQHYCKRLGSDTSRLEVAGEKA